jgi:hypothetical protein
VRLQKCIDEEAIDLRLVVDDFLVPVLALAILAQLQPVQRALARQSLRWITLLHQCCDQRIVTQLIVIVQILVTERQPHYPLTDQRAYRVFHHSRTPVVPKTSRELGEQTGAPVNLPQQQSAPVRAQLSAIKLGHYFASANRLETHLNLVTLCLSHAAAPSAFKLF